MPNELEVIQSETISETRETICDVRVDRSVDGLKVWIKSKIIEDFMREGAIEQHGRGSETSGLRSSKWTGASRVYDEAGKHHEMFNDVCAFKIGAWGVDGALYTSGKLNYSCLRAVGITEGITLTMPGICSVEQIREWVRCLKVAVKKYYLNTIKPVSVRITITASGIEEPAS